jgi:hypothetical protein
MEERLFEARRDLFSELSVVFMAPPASTSRGRAARPEVLLDEDDPVRFEGLPSGACTYAIQEDSEHPIYYGMVNPLTIVLRCETS